MQITLKLYAKLVKYLPEEAKDFTTQIEISERETIYSILDRLNIPKEFIHLVMINGVYIASQQRDQPLFKENDSLAIWPKVG